VVTPEAIAAFFGDTVGRKAREVFGMWLLPVGVDVSGGRIGTIVRGRKHALWEAREVDDLVEMFRRNFPQIPDVRALIGDDELKRFAGSRESRFPNIQRCRSLVGLVRGHSDSGGEAGVALLGDAAHVFPPDLGQGVNAALEDVILLCEALDAANTDGGGMHDALRRYEAGRDADVSALMRLMVIGGPYQYGQHRGWSAVWMANRLLRAGLARLAPGVFYPQVVSCINRDLRYSEVLAKVDETTRRIWMLAALLVCAIVAAVVALGWI
jgi:kynurenine 3-monooxygenase